MEVALIAPFEMLDSSSFGTYHLMLPHLTYDPRYVKHFKRLCQDPEKYVIMDNGAAEDVAMDWDVLTSHAWAYQVNEIVLPDVMGDPEATYHCARTFLEERPAVGDMHVIGYVLHGDTVEDTITAFYRIVHSSLNDLIDVFYIPRRLLVKTNEVMSRYQVATMININDLKHRDIHFLGMHHKFPEEPRLIRLCGRSRSLDTSLPYVLATYSRHFDALAGQHSIPAVRPDNYFERHFTASERTLSLMNTQTLERYAKEEG
jgi:hypothetical protein